MMCYNFKYKFINMNKNHKSLAILVLIIFSFLISNDKVLATVGGPTYISQIAYNASSNSVVYLENDMGGRGCLPIINSVNLSNNQKSQVKTCDEMYEEFSEDYDETSNQTFEEFFENYDERINQKHGQFISDFYSNLSYSDIWNVSLQKNNIDVDVDVLSEYVENGEKYWTEFRATITQDDREVAKIDFRGCHKEQPHIFEGYKIANSDIMVILISNKGNCMEGGYINETLHLIRGIKYYDEYAVRDRKENSAVEPSIGNRVVYARSEDVIDSSTDISTDNNINKVAVASTVPKKSFIEAIWISAIFIVAVALGYIMGRKSVRQ